MDVVVVGRHTKVSDEFRTRAIEKLRRIENIDPRAARIDIHVIHERNPKIAGERERVELTVHGHRPVVRAEAASDDRVTALDIAIDRVIERLRKRHERFSHRHQGRVGLGKHPLAESDPTSPSRLSGTATRDAPSSEAPVVVKRKVHSGPPMTTSEAIDHMELVGHDFYLFHDSESGLPSVVYRRRGWTYGVIHLEQEGEEGRDTLRQTA